MLTTMSGSHLCQQFIHLFPSQFIISFPFHTDCLLPFFVEVALGDRFMFHTSFGKKTNTKEVN